MEFRHIMYVLGIKRVEAGLNKRANGRIRKSKDRQNNDQKKKDKLINNDLQNTTHKTKDRHTRTALKTGVNPGAPG